MEKDVIRGRMLDKMKHIGHRVKFYRECKELPIKLFAERCGIEIIDALDIETGKYVKLDTIILLKVSEVLGIAYSDLFEMDDGRYYSDVDNQAVVEYLFRVAKAKKISVAYIGRTLEVSKSTYHNWSIKRRISSPFDMQNILSLLKVSADELSVALRKEHVTEEPKEEEAEKKAIEPESIQMLKEITKAIDIYRNVGTLIAQLDEIIEKAQKLKMCLGGK